MTAPRLNVHNVVRVELTRQNNHPVDARFTCIDITAFGKEDKELAVFQLFMPLQDGPVHILDTRPAS